MDESQKQELLEYIEKIEQATEEKDTQTDYINEIYKGLKEYGYNTKAIRELIKLRAMDRDKAYELEAFLEMYKKALGMVD
jgi:uncharacterized protein (UPF0335 family)